MYHSSPDKYSMIITNNNNVFALLSKYISRYPHIKTYAIDGIKKKPKIDVDTNTELEITDSSQQNSLDKEVPNLDNGINDIETTEKYLENPENNIEMIEKKENIPVNKEINEEIETVEKKENIPVNKEITEENDDYDYELILTIAPGEYKIQYKNEDIWINYRIQEEKPVGTAYTLKMLETITLHCIKKDNLLDFIEEARKFYKIDPPKKDIKVTNIYQYDVQKERWNILSKFKKRNIDSIFLDKGLKDKLVDDIDKFMKEEEVYEKYGIPYKRNYLLYGLPGTGKTSLIFSVASKYNYSVALFSFVPQIDDSAFMKCVSNIPKETILVLEDIDGLFMERNKDYNNKSMISFGGVLNTLDGMGRKDKQLTFLTTNHKENLDHVLLRPGRIDFNLEFTYATPYQIEEMYNVYINNQDSKKAFMQFTKNKKLTTCVLQKFFFENRDEEIMSKLDILEYYIDTYSNYGKNLYS